MAYLYGLLPKDFEWIRIEGNNLLFGNGEKKKIIHELNESSKYWIESIESLKRDEYGSIHHAIVAWNTQISDRVRKLTKKMKDDKMIKFAYTLSDIKEYYTHDLSRIEKNIANNQKKLKRLRCPPPV
jgi:hypothetical protein